MKIKLAYYARRGTFDVAAPARIMPIGQRFDLSLKADNTVILTPHERGKSISHPAPNTHFDEARISFGVPKLGVEEFGRTEVDCDVVDGKIITRLPSNPAPVMKKTRRTPQKGGHAIAPSPVVDEPRVPLQQAITIINNALLRGGFQLFVDGVDLPCLKGIAIARVERYQ